MSTTTAMPGRTESFRSEINTALLSLVPNEETIRTGFRFWQVEPLLVSSAEILERCASLLRRVEGLEEAKLNRDIEILRDRYYAAEANVLKGTNAETSYLAQQDLLDKRQRENLEGQEGLWQEAANNLTALWNKDSESRKQHAPAMSQLSISRRKYEGEVVQAQIRDRMTSMDASPSIAVTREIAMRNAVIKLREDASQPTRVQDYESRIAQTKQLLTRDYQDALDRLGAAAKGMRILFGYESDFGDELGQAHADIGDAVMSATILTRNALKWLSEFSGMDQAFTVSLSLRQHCSEEDIQRFLQGHAVSFTLPDSIFEDYFFVRLRGISACYQAKLGDATGMIRLRVVPPRLARVAWSIDRGGKVEQVEVPHCDVGRVAPFGFPQPLEIAGNIALMNVSPISDSTDYPWKVQLYKDSMVDGDKLMDVHLDLRCNGRPKTSPPSLPLMFFHGGGPGLAH